MMVAVILVMVVHASAAKEVIFFCLRERKKRKNSKTNKIDRERLSGGVCLAVGIDVEEVVICI